MLLDKTTVAGEVGGFGGCDCGLGCIDRVKLFLYLYSALGTAGGSHANVILVVDVNLLLVTIRKFVTAKGAEI